MGTRIGGDGQGLVLVGFGGLQTPKRAYLLDVSGVREFVGEGFRRPKGLTCF